MRQPCAVLRSHDTLSLTETRAEHEQDKGKGDEEDYYGADLPEDLKGVKTSECLIELEVFALINRFGFKHLLPPCLLSLLSQ